MKSILFCAVLLLAGVGLPRIAAAQHNHAEHAHVATPVPLPATKWHADADLRGGVERIHAALEALRGYESGDMDRATALGEARHIQQATADIFAKCKLGPEQDAVVHSMLMPLLTALNAFQAESGGAADVAAMRRAMADYPRYFDQPSWSVVPVH